MKIYIKLILIAVSSTMIFATCKKESSAPVSSNELVPFSIEFDNVVGNQNLSLNSVNYTNGLHEQFTVSLLQYFISNISLKKVDGSYYTVPQDSSYFLIAESDPEKRFARFNVPAGDYSQLTFVLGVDSLRSTMDITMRTGVLDPSGGMENGMYWGWNSGYIFFKMEGISPAAPLDPTGKRKFRYHIGGFGGYTAPTINNIKTITLDLTHTGIAKARADRKTNVHLMVDILKAFNGPTMLGIGANPSVMFSAYSVNIANNYTAMFRHDHTEN